MVDHKALFDAMPVPRFLISVGDNDKYVVQDANIKAIEYFNRREDQIINQELPAFIDANNARHFLNAFEVSVSRKMPVTIQALPNLPGGTRVHSFWINPVLDATGEVIILDIMGQPDMAGQSSLERERDDAITLLTSIFDVSEIGIIVTDSMQKIVRVNDSFVRTFGWTRDDLIGEDLEKILDPEERHMIKQNHEYLIESGERSSGEFKIHRKDEGTANVLFTTATLELSQNRRFQITTVMDITLRKQMETSLREAKEEADAANRSKSSFLANMSHELRTPLNAIIGFSEIMLNETFGGLGHKKYKEYVGDVHMSACHLLEIINEVLDMSKIEAGRIDLVEEVIDLNQLINAVIRIVSSRTFSISVSIDFEVNQNLPKVKADSRLVRQIMLNLLSNAVKYSEPGGEITIRARKIKTGIEISVSDRGIGIPKEKIKEALEPFGQVHSQALVRNNQGTGLGLPLAKAMAELHDGLLTLDSEVGKGTKVCVYLPEKRIVKSTDEDTVRHMH